MTCKPEQFPEGVLRIEKPHKIIVLVFASGKAVISGFKSANHIELVA